jgi:hypothetical protein
MNGCSAAGRCQNVSALTDASEVRSQKSDARYRKSETMSSKPNNKRVNSAKDLDVYRLAYDLAMAIFELSKHFPPEEKFALTTQIRRSSRSVGRMLGRMLKTSQSFLITEC